MAWARFEALRNHSHARFSSPSLRHSVAMAASVVPEASAGSSNVSSFSIVSVGWLTRAVSRGLLRCRSASVRFFVVGTDTGVGKTQVAAALLGLMLERGLKPFAFKPYESGVADLSAPADAMRLRAAAGGTQSLESVCLFRFEKPLAPGIAAKVERRPSRWREVLTGYRLFGRASGVIEGAGGLMVPLDATHDVIDLVTALKVPVVLVARAGLGTLNHTLLSLEALTARRVKVAAVVLNQATPTPDPSVPFNRAVLQKRYRTVPMLGPTQFDKAEKNRHVRLMKLLGPLV